MSVLKENIISLLQEQSSRALKAKDIARYLGVQQNEYQNMRTVLHKLVKDGQLIKIQKNRYCLARTSNEVSGELRVNSQGYGFVKWDTSNEVFISQKNMGTALHKDKVRVRLFATTGGKRVEGKVISVLQRARQQIVGTFRWGRRYGYVIPDEKKIQRDVVILPGDEKQAQEGQKVVCQIEQWEHNGLNPVGSIQSIIGFPNEPGVDIQSIIYRHELAESFPDAVIEQSQKIKKEIPESEIEKRLDLREQTIFTIDPRDAKDFDDAVSLEKLDDNSWLLGVHIADVSHYVEEYTEIDKEARKRGTSVYLVDRVIPMLPEHISNNVCSLEQDIEKLCFSILLKISPQGDLLDYDIRESVIKSKKRFDYLTVQEILQERQKSEFQDTLKQMFELSKLLIKKRNNRGGIDIDTVEVEISLNELGEPIDIKKRDRLDSHKLIEEFMLLANETVAKHVGQKLKEEIGIDVPFIYRIHEKPDVESVNELLHIAVAFGVNISFPKRIVPRYFQQCAKQFQKKTASFVLQDALLRTMKKAVYSSANIGHFGLAYKYYTHFTSPIRRYPDLIVHRLLKKYLFEKKFDTKVKEIENICKETTACEIRAQEVERAGIKLKQIQYLEKQLNQDFEGIICRVLHFGFFVELSNLFVDGLVHITSLDDDYYYFDEKNFRLVGQYNGKQYKLGDKIHVKLVRVDRNENLIDFVIAND